MVSLIEADDLPDDSQDWATSLRAVVSADISPLGSFDENDPLGFAFYTLVLLRTGAVTRANEKLLATARQWAEAKLDSDKLSVYRDRDLGALGVIVYAFAEYEIPLANERRLEEIALQESDGHSLIFDSFFLTSLIALGMAKTADGCPPQFIAAIEVAILSELERLRNDPKALLAGFWFARSIQRTDLSDPLFRVAEEMIFISRTNQLDGRLCCAAILLEKMEEMPVKRRLQLARFAQDCIKSVGIEAAGDGVRDMLLVEEGYLSSESPHVSKILVSVGLLCRDTLERKSSLLLTKWARTAQIIRGLFFAIPAVLLAIGVLWAAGRIRPPHPIISEMLAAPSFSTAAFALVLLLTYTALAGVFAFALLAVFELLVQLAILGKRRDEFAAFGHAWLSLRENYKIEVFLLPLAAVVFDLSIRR